MNRNDTDASSGDPASHARAVCPDCGMLNVTVQTAPAKAPRMYCTNCQWNSLDAEVK